MTAPRSASPLLPEIWTDLTGRELSPRERSVFLARPEAKALTSLMLERGTEWLSRVGKLRVARNMSGAVLRLGDWLDAAEGATQPRPEETRAKPKQGERTAIAPDRGNSSASTESLIALKSFFGTGVRPQATRVLDNRRVPTSLERSTPASSSIVAQRRLKHLLATLRTFGLRSKLSRDGKKADLRHGRRQLGVIGISAGGRVVVHAWRHLVLSTPVVLDNDLPGEVDFALALRRASASYDGPTTTISAATASIGKCVKCNAAIAFRGPSASGKWWHCQRFPICEGIGPVVVPLTVSQPVTAPKGRPDAVLDAEATWGRPLLRAGTTFIHEGRDGRMHPAPNIQIDSRGMATCPHCGEPAAVEFGNDS
jgi:ssDNA-binding Zn-finger/Zn-ribbon topoisomerase 1